MWHHGTTRFCSVLFTTSWLAPWGEHHTEPRQHRTHFGIQWQKWRECFWVCLAWWFCHVVLHPQTVVLSVIWHAIFSWQWMAGGPHGASGLHAGLSVPTGVEGNVPHQPPRTEARTATAWSCNPRTALTGSACKVSRLDHIGMDLSRWLEDVRLKDVKRFGENIKKYEFFEQQQ